jgi:hypothetical protein
MVANETTPAFLLAILLLAARDQVLRIKYLSIFRDLNVYMRAAFG